MGGYLVSQVWYYKVVAYDGTLIQYGSNINSGFTTTMKNLDGAVVFFRGGSMPSSSAWTGAEKATDGNHNIVTTKYIYSWSGN